jgi:L-fuculose-phosphate aldolase
MQLDHERQIIVDYGKKLITQGLTKATGGNLSVFNRKRGLAAISPSGLDYFKTSLEDVPVVDLDGCVAEGLRKPSSEMPFHLIFYKNRPDIDAVVHTHSLNATALACLGLELPPLHYLIGFAGKNVRCAKYATFGTDVLAQNALAAMSERKAVLLANHGLIAGGADMQEAFMIAELVEFCAEIYFRCRTLGQPTILPDAEMDRVIEKFKNYGRQ